MTPGTLPLTANRWTPFIYVIDFEGYDFTTADFAMQVRLRRDAPGDALVDLTNATAGSEGISVAVALDGDDVPTSTVTIQIDEATLEPLLLNAGKAGADQALVWDIHIEDAGLPKQRWLQGPFTLAAGSTQ
jgi:hypothetical protein